MYEDFLGLSKRPFSSVPNPDCFVPVLPAQEALDSLIHCVTQSRGIGVVTSAPGLGKSQLCKQLAVNLNDQFQAVYLSTSGFHTRRALLQSILYELGISYVGLSEQESRLRIFEAASASYAEGRVLLIVADEAHLLNNRLFEELRTLGDHAPEGTSLIRLILSGEFELEEKLADPSMSAFNQRVGCQVCLDPYSLQQSAQFIQHRLDWAGAENLEDILTEDALEAICRASDGNPRCLNQLADQACLISYAEEQKPITRGIVLAALNDVKGLPLTWTDLNNDEETHIEEEGSETGTEVESFEAVGLDNETLEVEVEWALHEEAVVMPNVIDPLLDTDEFQIPEEITALYQTESENEEEVETTERESSPVEFAILEVGAEDASQSSNDEELCEETEQLETIAEQHEHYDIEVMPEQQIADEVETLTMDVNRMIEKAVIDRYAFLDRMGELPEEAREDILLEVPCSDEDNLAIQMNATGEIQLHAEDCDDLEHDILQTIEALHTEIINPLHAETFDARDEEYAAAQQPHEWLEYDVIQPAGEQNYQEAETFAFEPEIELGEPTEFDESEVDLAANTLIDSAEIEAECENVESEQTIEESLESDAPVWNTISSDDVSEAMTADDDTVMWTDADSTVEAPVSLADEVPEADHIHEQHGSCNQLCNGSCGCASESRKEVATVELDSPSVTETESTTEAALATEVDQVVKVMEKEEPKKQRRFEQLFTRLRWRRRKVQQEQTLN